MELIDIDVWFDFLSDTPNFWDGFWERKSGYGAINKTCSTNRWMSSLYTEPVEYLEECIWRLKNEMKVVEYDRELYSRLLALYGDMKTDKKFCFFVINI